MKEERCLMSYSKTIFKKFIKAEIKRANSLNEKLTTGQSLGIDSDNPESSKRLQTYKEKWGFDYPVGDEKDKEIIEYVRKNYKKIAKFSYKNTYDWEFLS